MEITLPRLETLEETSTHGRFVVEPLDRGYGVTLGNSLRRVMLSSIEGAAVTDVQIEGVLHEFSMIPGLKEDTTELLLNLKSLYVRVDRLMAGSEGGWKIRVDRSGPGRVTGADVECPAGLEIANPEVYLATMADASARLCMEMTVELGKGYVLPEKQEKRGPVVIGVMPVGAAFTPVRQVNFTVDATRVGFKTDLERLTMEVVTNGTMTPRTAVSEAAQILTKYFRYFASFGGAQDEDSGLGGPGGRPDVPDVKVEELEFSSRTFNCLKRDSIDSLSKLVQKTEAELLTIRNLGRKSLAEIVVKLRDRGLELKGGTSIKPEELEAVSAGGSADDEEAEGN
jgi:DNA-directed RNA polymerase subunit alpha